MKYLVFFLVFASITPFLISDVTAVAPVERVPITSFAAYSSDGKEIQEIIAGKQVSLVSNVTNTQDTRQSFVYGAWIAENNGTNMPIDWIEASLDAKSSSVFSIPWTPDAAGKYTIEASIWENNETFTAFSAIWQVTLDVVAKDSHEKLISEPTPVCKKGTILKGNTCIVPNAVCGKGTTYQNGTCVVDEPVENKSSSGKWTSPYRETILPPIKQIQNGVKFHNVECKEGLELVYKKAGDISACVTLTTKVELVVRGWAKDTRILLGCTGDRVHKCYPDDPNEYRKALHSYYFGNEKNLPSSDAFDFTALHTINACTSKPWVCQGEFDNGTKIRVACDYPIHGCGVKSFDTKYYNEDCNENCKLENRRIESAPANDPKDSFPVQYDAVIEGTIQWCIGHKGYPVRYQCDILVDSYIKFDGQRTEQFTALSYDYTLISDEKTKTVFGLDYHPDDNYYEIVEIGFSRR